MVVFASTLAFGIVRAACHSADGRTPDCHAGYSSKPLESAKLGADNALFGFSGTDRTILRASI